ncbi:MAG TPA: hypothetical protein VLG76_02510 [Rhabdochlamydiaceae bacterium]|nr:hypothetical protein [Rhabdochlamydiaceae bacterium]
MNCWSCGTELPDPTWGKLSFRATCDRCNAALHCCKNCKYYQPGSPNDCRVPGTDWVRDRSATNLCEEFGLMDKVSSSKSNNSKQRFDDLFKK